MCSYEYAFRIEHLLEKAALTDQKWSLINFPDHLLHCITKYYAHRLQLLKHVHQKMEMHGKKKRVHL